MSITSRTSAVLLATAVAGLTAVGAAASSDDWETPIASAVSTEPDCNAPPSDEPRDEQALIEELVTELQCLEAPSLPGTNDAKCGQRTCCTTDPD